MASEQNTLKKCPFCAEEIRVEARKCRYCGEMLSDAEVSSSQVLTHGEGQTIRRLSDYERISGAVWLLLACVQAIVAVLLFSKSVILPGAVDSKDYSLNILFGFSFAVAAIWNLLSAISRFVIAAKIRNRDKTVVESFHSIAQLVLLGVINLIFGGVLGVFWVAFDFFARDKVLSNAHLFNAHLFPVGSSTAETTKTLNETW